MAASGTNPKIVLSYRRTDAAMAGRIFDRLVQHFGKSSLFNWLAGRRISIVDPTAGVTRDRVATTVEHFGRHFSLVDTGGMGIVDVDNLTDDVERQIRHAIDEAGAALRAALHA